MSNDSDRRQDTNSEPVNPATGRLILYWLVVLIPLGYGVYNTLLKSVPLFGG